MRRGASIVCIATILLLSAFVFPMGVENEVEAVGEPAITIQLAQTKQTAYVAPGQDGIVTFTGTVFVQIPYAPNVQYLVVELNAYADGFPVSTPPALTFSKAQKQQSFTLSVQVPIGTSSKQSYQLELGGTWYYEPGLQSGEIDPAYAVIVVDHYYDFVLFSEDLFSEALRGEVIDPVISVRNTGNGDDEISLEIANIEELHQAGIEPHFSENTPAVPENETGDVILFLRCSKSMHKGSHAVEIEAHSAIAERYGEVNSIETLTIYVDVVDMKSEPETGEEEEEESEPEDEEEEEEPEEEPEPEPEPESEPEPEPDNELETDDPEIENNIGTIEGGRSSGISSVVLVAIFLIVVLLACLGVGVFFYVRAGKKSLE